ncbi:MAG TPA: ABC transporter substrate-binding protein [Deinococcales bacterium]|nr:ABC transporter substrate-binding protein [Deinococcales bacterium]
MRKAAILVLGAALVAGAACIGTAQTNKAKLVIESWRNDDLKIWQDQIIPAFNKHYPDIQVVFNPTAPAEYNGVLASKLKAGTAGDLITCRPFDVSLEEYQAKQITSLNDLPGMNNFSEVAKSAWQTDDGKTTFCVPMASVIHGFIYNKDIFNQLGLKEPVTEADFYAVLDKIKKDGRYAPLVMGTNDQWESATMGYQNIGPNYWEGEKGRKALIAGTAKYNTGGFLQAFEALAKWRPYMMPGYQATSYSDAQNFFAQGRGAIYPAGSWDISVFRSTAKFPLGAFKPPLPAGKKVSYISDHTDIAMGMNAATKNPDAARKFLQWMTTQEFAQLYSNALPGFFSLSKFPVKLSDPLAQEFLDWRKTSQSTIRSAYQILNRGKLSNENDLWNASAQVLNGSLTPKAAADMVQKNLDSWYHPGK